MTSCFYVEAETDVQITFKKPIYLVTPQYLFKSEVMVTNLKKVVVPETTSDSKVIKERVFILCREAIPIDVLFFYLQNTVKNGVGPKIYGTKKYSATKQLKKLRT